MEDERLERYWSGYRLRYRRAVSNASAGGVECPPLAQAQRCRSPFSGCTRWQVRPLETCHLSAANATCGPGYQDVVFQCQRYDGVSIKIRAKFQDFTKNFICVPDDAGRSNVRQRDGTGHQSGAVSCGLFHRLRPVRLVQLDPLLRVGR